MTQELREWVEKAESDWQSASDLLQMPAVNAGLVLFLCQQCIEKLMKAALIKQGQVPPKTHDLVSLSKRLSAGGVSWSWDVPMLRRLSKWGRRLSLPGCAGRGVLGAGGV